MPVPAPLTERQPRLSPHELIEIQRKNLKQPASEVPSKTLAARSVWRETRSCPLAPEDPEAEEALLLLTIRISTIMEWDDKRRPTTGPYASRANYLAYVAKEYQAVEALGDPDDPKTQAYLAKLDRILERAEEEDRAAARSSASESPTS
jgi:hypothetical protein